MFHFNKKDQGWECNSVVERLTNMCKVMSLIPSIGENFKKEEKKKEKRDTE
jgi:hypothetical protein